MHTVRIAVTGLKEAGKTVFLTSLINHLLEGSEETLPAFKDEAVTFSGVALPPRDDLQPFPYYSYLDRLRHERPEWPERTWQMSGFRLALTLRDLRRRQTRYLRLELVDYPGERLLDFPLLKRSWELWSDEVARDATLGLRQALSGDWLARCDEVTDGAGEEAVLLAYAAYMQACRARGLTFLQPSAVLLATNGGAEREAAFCPLPAAARKRAPETARRFASRYDAYVRGYVRPFLRRMGRSRRQIVLVDVLRILRQGVHSYNDTRRCLRSVLDAFDYAVARHRLSPRRLVDLLRRRIRRVAFVATKADQCTRATRGNLRFLLEELIAPKRRELAATLPNGRPRIMFCAAHRSTRDATKQYDGRALSCLRGIRADGPPDHEGPWFPGEVPPEWPDQSWDPDEEQFRFPDFLPRRLPMRDGAVIEHLNMDKVFWHCLEDLLT